jgi:hypothetical protein
MRVHPRDILISKASELFAMWLRARNVRKAAGFVFRERSKPRFDNILSFEYIDRINVSSMNEFLEKGRFQT